MKLSVSSIFFVICFCAISTTNAYAQQIQRCHTTEYTNSQLEQNPNLANDLLAVEAEITKASRSKTNKRTLFTIPIVVHVVYNTERPGDNISDDQIMSQIEVLNEDYQAKNEDLNEVPNRFENLIANMDIEFCLANRDENGNFTSGVTRTETTVDEFTTSDNQIKRPELGGVKAWDRDKFLNIWIGRLENEILGYATPPGFPSSIDGVVIGTRYFGKGGQYNLHLAYNKGRTTTHEIGHWLGLRHTWGNEYGCNYDDGIEDTPISDEAYFDCPEFSEAESCGSRDMTMNFMEYVNDDCMQMFTLVEILYCEKGAFPIRVTVANLGTEDINSVRIQYTVNNGNVFDFNKVISIPVGTVEEINLSNLNLFGVNVVDIRLVEVNGGEDAINGNNTISLEVTIPEFGTLPLIERFESGIFEQDGWIVKNPDDDEFEWQRSTAFGAPPSGRGCLVFNNFSGEEDNNPRNTIDHLETPTFDFTNNSSVSFSFSRAYAPYDEELIDALRLSYSIDCGKNWEPFWFRDGTGLGTHPSISNGDPFEPSIEDWVNETIDLSTALNGQSSVQFRITNQSGWGQLLYIDNIEVSGIVDVNTFPITKKFTIAPNPSSTGKFLISSISTDANSYQLSIFDVAGKQIFSDQINTNKSQYQLNLNKESNGIYMLQLSNNDKSYTGRIIVAK